MLQQAFARWRVCSFLFRCLPVTQDDYLALCFPLLVSSRLFNQTDRPGSTLELFVQLLAQYA